MALLFVLKLFSSHSYCSPNFLNENNFVASFVDVHDWRKNFQRSEIVSFLRFCYYLNSEFYAVNIVIFSNQILHTITVLPMHVYFLITIVFNTFIKHIKFVSVTQNLILNKNCMEAALIKIKPTSLRYFEN